MSDKTYHCRDFQTQKRGETFRVGIFAPGIYAAAKDESGSCASDRYTCYYKISKEEFDGFPQNEKELEERLLSDLLVSFANQLCNNYVDHCAFFTQEKYDSIEI